MTKTKELNKLFREWQDEFEFGIFCKDGIVDEENYGKGIPGVVFLLKDANVRIQEEADVCRNLLDTANGEQPFGKMWKVICMWTKILENPALRYSECCINGTDIDDSIKEYLKKIAVVNVCKEHGNGVNEHEEIDAKVAGAVEWYYDYTKKELDIIDPELVICCGTYPFIKKAYSVCDKTLPSGARYFIKDSKIFLEMCHPANRLRYSMLFAYFKEVYSDFDLN